MPYYSGQVSNFVNLHAALVAAAQTEGWTWSAANNTLEKNGVAFEVIVNTTVNLRFRLGESVNGSGVLQNPMPAGQYYGHYNGTGDYLITWPIDYKLFFKGDSIVVSINYNTFMWQHVVIGRGRNLGVAGNCNFMFGTSGVALNTGSTNFPPFDYRSGYYTGALLAKEPAAFYGLTTISNDYVGGVGTGGPITYNRKCELMNNTSYQPSRVNGQVVLLPIQIAAQRPSSTYSYIAELPDIRVTRNTNFNDGDIMVLGPDRWMILPWFRRNVQTPNGSSSQHSGTHAIAIPYDGP